MIDKIRILIADDHPLFRDGMHGLLDSVPDTEVVGEATSGEEVIAQAAILQPDVILMDIKMPGINGIAATREILAASPHIGILMVTIDRKSTRLNSSHPSISYAVFCLKKKNKKPKHTTIPLQD